MFPLKIVLPPAKSRVLYFKSRSEHELWTGHFKEAMGYANLFDFYELNQTLGKG